MAQRDNIFNAVLKKVDGKVVYENAIDRLGFEEFVKNLEEGQMAEIFLDANRDDGTLTQLAKIHKCIRELALIIGYSYMDMKLEVKKKSGLCIKKEFDGEMYMICKSFSRCSKDELSLTIQTIIEMGDEHATNFR
jgi:hypothetical protein